MRFKVQQIKIRDELNTTYETTFGGQQNITFSSFLQDNEELQSLYNKFTTKYVPNQLHLCNNQSGNNHFRKMDSLNHQEKCGKLELIILSFAALEIISERQTIFSTLLLVSFCKGKVMELGFRIQLDHQQILPLSYRTFSNSYLLLQRF